MAIELTPFDAAEHLTDTDAQAELLNDALESGNAAYIANALGVIARARGMTTIASETGLQRQGLYKALSAEGNPTIDTFFKVLDAVGFKLHAASA